uniref:Ring finger protein 122 n=1 Tax=Astyanax mexicanus TaxID=7994 RepID=A0A8B9KVG9_ASTMX
RLDSFPHLFAFQDLFLNIYMGIFGTGIFVFILSLIFCCCFIRYPNKMNVLILSATLNLFILSIHLLSQQTCAVCLEDFRIRDEIGMLPCQHGFHKRCLVKWLEVRCVCPMCNKPLSARNTVPLLHNIYSPHLALDLMPIQ